MNGKQKCRMLKEIRQRIADENDIPYVTRECRFQGECRGTCPRCESELRYLERELAKRRSMKKKVTVAALCAGMVIASAGCGSSGPVGGNDTGGAVPYENSEYTSEKKAADDTGSTDGNSTDDTGSTGSDDLVEETGEVPYPEDYEESEDNQGSNGGKTDEDNQGSNSGKTDEDNQGSNGGKTDEDNQSSNAGKRNQGDAIDDKNDSTEVFVTTGEVPYPEEDYGTRENNE